MPEFLLEIGVEELPASIVRSAAEQLLELLRARIEDAELGGETPVWYATPRRLIVSFPNIIERQPDKTIEKRGPAAKAAFSQDGAATPALIGFCKSLGVTPDKAQIRDDYVWVSAEVKGRISREVLAELIPDAVKNIAFEKTMRWGKARTRFSRPIRWILALCCGDVVSFSIEDVGSSNKSRGHRILAPEEFEVSSLQELLAGLRKRFVEPEPAIREKTIRESAREALLTDELVDENVFLTEWPVALTGSFREEFLELPRPVLITAMAKHEKFFPVAGPSEKLTNKFISITNGGDEETVRGGNEWVLNARFNDAKFFYDEDIRHDLTYFLEKTARILFQDKLGTVRQRADRIANIAKNIASDAGLPKQEIEWCEKAGLLCKADLSTGLVSELPSLQGKIGGEYAHREGQPDAVCWGIAAHYDPDRAPDCEGGRTALVVMCADQADRLAGYLGIGEAPSGSSDPYALRRAATMLLEAKESWEVPKKEISDWVLSAVSGYREQGIELQGDKEIRDLLIELLEGRFASMHPDIPHDVRDAVFATIRGRGILSGIAAGSSTATGSLRRAKALAGVSTDIQFVRTAKRPANIVSAAKKKNIDFGLSKDFDGVDVSLFEHPEEKKLLDDAQGIAKLLGDDPEKNISVLRKLAPPIDAFFDKVMVMTDNEKVRNNRLLLLSCVDQLFRKVGDFSKIVIEGE